MSERRGSDWSQRAPESDRFLIDFALREHARRRGDHVALILGEQRVSYRELDALADRWTALFVERGVARGERVVVALDNSLEVVASFYGALRADAIPCIVGAGKRARRITRIIALAEPRTVVVAAQLAASVREALPQGTSAIVVGGEAGDPLASIAVEAARSERRSIELDVATICWTSGSTGEPKGVMLTHQNLRNSTAAIATYLEHDERDVVLCVLPLSHTYGLFQMLVTFGSGGTLVLERGFAMAFPLVKRLAELNVTGFAGVPTIYAAILALRGLEDYPLPSLRYLTNAAYALPAPHLMRINELWNKARFFAMYGQTECTRVCYLPPQQALQKPSSVGIPMPNVEVWIEKPDGSRAGPGETGELVVRGPNVMRGYFRDPEATARALRPGPIPGELVLHTGDLFRSDEDGYLYFVARSDDVIKTRGEKVAPREVEQAICTLPGVLEAAVLGVPDPVHGVGVKAVVVRVPGTNVSADDVKRAVFAELDEVAVPRIVEFVDSLPKTESGKLLRSELH
jgi:acyl-CoA synthetase (AMP-forming)/AMP-acid ligase II